MVNKLENSVAHWFLPSQKYVTLQSYLLLNISARDLHKHSFYYLPSLLKHRIDVLIIPHNQRNSVYINKIFNFLI